MIFEELYKMGVPVQSLNLFHVISLMIFPKLMKKIRLTPISRALILFYTYALFITVINFLLASLGIPDKIPLMSIARQVAGLSLGIIIFFVLREIFKYRMREALYFSTKFSIILLVFSTLVFDILLNHKLVRICATFSEPSHLGQYLVFIILPSLLLLNIPKVEKNLFVSITIFLIFLTFSFTTYVRFIVLLVFFLFFTKNIKSKVRYSLLSLLLLTCGLVAFSTLFSNSYVGTQVLKNVKAIFLLGSIEYGTLSLVDRMQIIFILKSFWKIGISGITGVGLGFEKLYLNILYPEEILNSILSVKHFNSYLNSFWGKVVLYTGIIGFCLFLYFLIMAFKAIKSFTNLREEERTIVQATLFSIYSYALFGLAPFQTIELWFWLAFIDSFYLSETWRRNKYG